MSVVELCRIVHHLGSAMTTSSANGSRKQRLKATRNEESNTLDRSTRCSERAWRGDEFLDKWAAKA
jgi:hypothetical protein